MTRRVEINIDKLDGTETITAHIRAAKNGFAACFGPVNRRLYGHSVSGSVELVATSAAAIKRAMMVEFEERLDAQLKQLKSDKADARPDGGSK